MKNQAVMKRITKWSTPDGNTLELNAGWPVVRVISSMKFSLSNAELEKMVGEFNSLLEKRNAAAREVQS